MSAAPKPLVASEPPITPEEYLTRERLAEIESEYYDGEIFAMAGVSREHSLITSNVTAEFSAQLFDRPCEVHTSDMKVRATETTFAYPDATVVCGEPEFADEETDVLLSPTLIVEVLSRTTEAWDRGGKFERYQQRASLLEYVLIAQDRPRVERYSRQADGQWLLSVVEGLDKVLALPAIGCELQMARINHKVTWPQGS